MPIDDFDRGVVEKFNSHEFEYNPQNWEKLASRLPEKKGSVVKRMWFWASLAGVAAALTIFAGRAIFVNDNVHNDIVHTTQPTVKKTSTANTTVATPLPTAPIDPVAENQPTNTASSTNLVARKNNMHSTTIENNTTVTPSNAVASHLTNNNTANPNGVNSPIEVTTELPESTYNYESKIARQNIDISKPITKNSNESPITTMSDDNSGYTIDGNKTKTKSLSVSLVGGYVPQVNTSYSIGVNTRKDLSNRIYVEGDVAYAYNQRDKMTQQMNNETFDAYKQNTPEMFALASGSKAGARPVSDMKYVQVSPIVGVKVLDKLSVGAGADVQRLVNGSENQTYYVYNDGKVLVMPHTDMGIVGKTEYQIFKNLKAGLQYRYGMNKTVSGNAEYFDRNYLQMQLKLGIIGRK